MKRNVPIGNRHGISLRNRFTKIRVKKEMLEYVNKEWEEFKRQVSLIHNPVEPDPRWSEHEQLVGSEPGMHVVDQLVSEHDQLADLEKASSSETWWREDE